jgi:hypothetical protein
MSHYIVCANVDKEIDWSRVKDLWINQFPWHNKGDKEKTKVQMVHSDDAIHLKVTVWDETPYCVHEHYGDPVYEDSCFEWFFSPQQDQTYINLEVNAKGVVYLAFGDGLVEHRQPVAYELAKLIHIVDRKTVIDEANCWTLEICFPKKLIQTIIGHPIHYHKWKANFYRCGGKTNPQYATWSPVNHSLPQFHLPEYFGDLSFA